MNTAIKSPKTKRISKNVVGIVSDIIGSKPKRIADLVKQKAEVIPPLRVSFGADPELMLFDIDQNRIVSSIPVLKQDKHNPILLGDGIKMYADNVLVECSFPPSKDKNDMIGLMKTVFERMQTHLGDKYRLVPKAAHNYLPEELIPSHGIDPAEIGCTPSIDVYKEEIVMPGGFPDTLRTGSFHIHLGNADFDKENGGHLLSFNGRHAAIRLMDIFVGCASVVFDKDETSVARRKLYGQAGNFRMTPYGVEYRCLPPGPLASQKTTELCIDLTDYVASQLRAGNEIDIIKSVKAEDVQKAINTCDAALAEQILVSAGLSSELLARVKTDYGAADFNKSWGI